MALSRVYQLAANKRVRGLLKIMHPFTSMEVEPSDLLSIKRQDGVWEEADVSGLFIPGLRRWRSTEYH